jgi:hypothetical protein
MKQPFDDYECEGQMNINEWLRDLSQQVPFKCCNIKPWLHISACYGGKEQTYQMYYVCPKCLKVATDGTEWIDRSYGTYEVAKKRAIRVWNNPTSTKHQDEEYIHFHDYEKFSEMYGVETGNDLCLELKAGDFDKLEKAVTDD